MDARADLYSFAMRGKEHSPQNSEKASELIDAHAHELAEKIRAKVAMLRRDGVLEPDKDLPASDGADLIDPEVHSLLELGCPGNEV